jgi:hypothetical protein
MHLSLEEVAVHAGHEVLMEVDDSISQIACTLIPSCSDLGKKKLENVSEKVLGISLCPELRPI